MMLGKQKTPESGGPIWLDSDLRKVFDRTSMKIMQEKGTPFIKPADIVKILIENYEGKLFDALLAEVK